MPPDATSLPTPSFDEIVGRATLAGVSVRGAYCPTPEDELLRSAASNVGTFVLLGFTGSRQWAHFASSSEARDNAPDPLDRWSRRVIGALAVAFAATAVFPSGQPRLPFQRLAARCEPVTQSPIGLLIHPVFGLWHAYRGALLLPGRIALPTFGSSTGPCSTCELKPCLSGCPVRAFRGGEFNLAACAAHVESDAGSECRDNGCLARRACPVGSEYRYSADQASFHMAAFRRSIAR